MPRAKVAVTREHTGDAQQDRIQGEFRGLIDMVRANPLIYGRSKSVRFVGGVHKVVNHGLGVPAACFPMRMKYSVPTGRPEDPLNYRSMWVERALKGTPLGLTFNNPAGNFTTGCRFQVGAVFNCIGIRALYCNGGAARTYRLRLWDDTSGNSLASVDVAVAANTSGVITGYFTNPVDLSALQNSNLTASMWETSAAVYTKTTTDAFQTFCPIVMPECTASAVNLFVAGDARPTGASGGENFWVEPIFEPIGIMIDESPKAMQDKIDPKKSLSLIATTSGDVDLWFYPRVSKPIDLSTGQSL